MWEEPDESRLRPNQQVVELKWEQQRFKPSVLVALKLRSSVDVALERLRWRLLIISAGGDISQEYNQSINQSIKF